MRPLEKIKMSNKKPAFAKAGFCLLICREEEKKLREWIYGSGHRWKEFVKYRRIVYNEHRKRK